MSFQKVVKLCELAVSSKGTDLRFVPRELITLELCEKAVDQDYYNSEVFRFVPEEFKTFEMCNLVVQQSGRNLEYVPEHLKTYEMCEMGVEDKYGYALEYVPMEFRTPELCEKAVMDEIWNLKHVPEELRTLELCEMAIEKCRYWDNSSTMLMDVPEEFQEELAEKYDIDLPEKSKGR